MEDRIPSGTRDVLPDEMRELRALSARMRGVFDGAGYGELYTPALEYERTFTRNGARTGTAYRLFDEHGDVLVLRSDMTVPIARVVGNRYAHAEPPLRFCYFAHAYRSVRPQRGQTREFLQAGTELIGVPGPAGTAEVLSVLCDALQAAGLKRFRVGLGDQTLYPRMLERVGVGVQARTLILASLSRGDFVGAQRVLCGLELSDADRRLLLEVPRMRGGAELLEGLSGPLREVGEDMRAILGRLRPPVAQRMIFDLGLVRDLGYYSGSIFQVYDPAHGVPLGSGGRYDELLAEFGRPLPAVGFALDLERVHVALTAEERETAEERDDG
ncbi:MAG: ATP phosphoribosyltransferase regulatory subunit [Solirubrobacteraceae bacterium]